MPTILSHAAVPIALAVAVAPRIPGRLLLAGIALSMLPDLDVLAFKLGIPYASPFGHRGFSHSLLFAALCAALLATCLRTAELRWPRVFAYLFVAMASHGLLDSLTSGGLGPALLWPFSSERIFAPLQPIAVSPIGVAPMFSARGWAVLQSELQWVWAPALLAAWLWRGLTRFGRTGETR
ncbi:metal-dependent hydrolase [Chitinimonas sp.]|uniref:metal-dependent hydrolase n=1 Tax=Chitinimonas sp. TaxID=1934313 RepID=UPI0035B02B82